MDNASSDFQIVLHTEGDDLYAAMLLDIAAAQEAVRLESYIFAGDEIGREFVAALVAQARAGRKVWLRVDAAGSWDVFESAVEKELSDAGVVVTRCHRWRVQRFWKFQRRNHRKLLVIDETIGYLGGFNIHRENSRRVYGDARWRDTHMRLTGTAATQARQAFDAYSKRRIFEAGSRDSEFYLLPNRGLRGRWQLHTLLRHRIRTARQRVWLTTPYFVPDFSTQRALCAAARRGVDVRVLLPARSDVRLAQWAGRAAYSGLLTAGVKIYEYQPRVLHAKTMLCDDDFATVGTANFDYRSFFINDELNAVLRRRTVVEDLAALFLRDLSEAEPVDIEPWRHRSFSALIAESIGWLARRWL